MITCLPLYLENLLNLTQPFRQKYDSNTENESKAKYGALLFEILEHMLMGKTLEYRIKKMMLFVWWIVINLKSIINS